MSGLFLFPLILTFSAIWSSAFIVGKVATLSLDPYSLLGWRYGLSALVLLPLALRRPGWRRRELIRAAVPLGLFNNVAYLGLTFTALLWISPALVVVIVSCAPFITALIVALLGQERLSPTKLTGVTIGFCGVLTISLHQPIGGATVGGIVLAVLGTLAFSIGTLLYRRGADRFDPVQVNLWQSMTGVVMMAPIGWLFGHVPDTVEPGLVLAVLYLAFVVTIGGMGLWLFLIRVSGAASASSYHLLNPAFAVLFSSLVFGTAITAHDVGGMLLIGLGLLLVTRITGRKPA